MRRLVGLSWRINRASKVKSLLLVVLVAVSMTVFLVVTELSRVSSVDLDEAIASELGQTGTYLVDVDTDFGLGRTELARQVGDAVAPYAVAPPLMVDVLPLISAECPPHEALGPQTILVMRDASGHPVRLPFGKALPVDTELCLDAMRIPAAAVYLPTEEEQVRWGGSGLYVEQTYEPLVLATTTDPVHYRFIVVTGVQDDKYDAIQQAVVGGLTQAGQRYGDDATHRVFVTRTDTAGADVRSASEGVKLVYGIIGWGVLVLGGLGLLVAELIVVRDRMWFLGLARAVGARARQVAGLIVTDVLLVLLAGTALALLLATVVQPVANQFAHDAFGISVQLLHPGIVRQLAAGGLLVLVVAAGYPVWHALRQDPLDVLEPRAG